MKKNNAVPSPKTIEVAFYRLKEHYKTSKTELHYETPFQLLIAVILSAQCTDARVNLTTPALFAKYPTPEAMALASLEDLERLVKSTGFFRMKAKAIQKTSQDLVDKFKGQIPDTIPELITLAGVGRKTASVMLNQAFDKPAIAVDTHVKRVANLLGWSRHADPEKIEFELRDLIPEKWWSDVNGFLIFHGRRICVARRPKCDLCFLNDLCPSAFGSATKPKPKSSKGKSRA